MDNGLDTTLYKLLTNRREEVLAKCRDKVIGVMGSRSSTTDLDKGLPILYDELLEVLRISLENDSPETRQRFVSDTITASASRQHAQESYRLGYTVSQLVHGYGCICQGITEFPHEVGAPITSGEFSQLNLCLDVAIAQAVSEFETLSLAGAEDAEVLRLGYLAHELRNYLSNAIMAHELIRSGGVGAAGATSTVLANAHQQMKKLIDRAVAEVRMGAEPEVMLAKVHLFGLVSEVESSALPEANAKGISLRVDVDPTLEVEVDRHLLASALANLVQNAIKFTERGGNVWIRANRAGGEVAIEVEDRCGGLADGRIEELFKPYFQDSRDRSGLGLGLSIAKRAVELNGGRLTARNLPDTGCIFSLHLPAAAAVPDTRSV